MDTIIQNNIVILYIIRVFSIESKGVRSERQNRIYLYSKRGSYMGEGIVGGYILYRNIKVNTLLSD